MHESELKKKKKKKNKTKRRRRRKAETKRAKKHNSSVSVCMQTGYTDKRSNMPHGHQPSGFHINYTLSNEHF